MCRSYFCYYGPTLLVEDWYEGSKSDRIVKMLMINWLTYNLL